MTSNDKRMEDLLRQMYAEERLIDEAWTKFVEAHPEAQSEAHLEAQQSPASARRTFWGQIYKLAAAFVGLLMLSGIAYAAIRIGRDFGNGQTRTTADSVAVRVSRMQNSQPAAPKDSVQTDRPIVFEDAELAQILDAIGEYYHVKISFQREEAKHVRLYFTWDKTMPLSDVVEIFNKFERIHIKQENQKLTVE